MKARCCASSSGRIGRSDDRFAVPVDGLRELGRVGRDREVRGAGRRRRALEAHARIERDHAVVVGPAAG